MTIIDIISEPRNETYISLLQIALEFCVTFSLVWRDQSNLNQSAIDFEMEVRPFLEKEEQSNTWPGTELFDSFAIVRFYRYTSESMALLKKVSGLYEWQEPHFPEDPAFYRENGQCWLTTIAHETDAFLDINEKETDYLGKQIPSLKFKSHE
jgi:hypothetical protein